MSENTTIVARIEGSRNVASQFNISDNQWRLLCDAIFPSAQTPDAVYLALEYCRTRNLDIFKRPVHIVPMWNKELGRNVETVWPGINSIVTDASRTGAFAGMDAPEWGPDITREFSGVKDKWDRGQKVGTENVSAKITYPEWCSVTVYRLVNGQRAAFSLPVFWEEAAVFTRAGIPNEMWSKRVRGQLHKCAMAASLRVAFPEAADYAAEEMEGRDTKLGGAYVINGTAEDVTPQADKKAPEPDTNAGQADNAAQNGERQAEQPRRGRGRPPGSANKPKAPEPETAGEAEKAAAQDEAPKAESRVAQADAALRQASEAKAEASKPEAAGIATVPNSSPAIKFIGQGNKEWPSDSIATWRSDWLKRVEHCAKKDRLDELERRAEGNMDVFLDLYEGFQADVDAVVEAIAKALPAFRDQWDANFQDGSAEDENPPM